MAAPNEPLLLAPVAKNPGHLPIRRLLPARAQRAVGPFVFFDHFGPTTIPAGANADVRPHPHIGLATVTYLFDGEMMHRDSLGTVQRIVPGDLNWMNAGRGIVHSERFGMPADRDTARRAHGLQLWVALPRAHEESAPAFQHVPASALPTCGVGGAFVRVVAGHAYGRASPVRTLSSLFYAEVRLPAGASVPLPDEHEERAVYVLEGEAALDDVHVPAFHMGVAPRGAGRVLRARTPVHAMVLGGAPLDGERFLDWNFVATSRARLAQARADWRAMRFPLIPGDDAEHIPLPE